MDKDIDQMIAGRFVLVEVIIQSKAKVADGSGSGRVFTKSGIPKALNRQVMQAYGRVFCNSQFIVKNKGAFESIGIG